MDTFPSIEQLLFGKPKLTGKQKPKLDATKIEQIIALQKSGLAYRRIAAKFSVSPATIVKVMKKYSPETMRPPISATEEEKKLIIALRNSGHSVKSICEQSNMHYSKVYRVLNREKPK